MVSSQQLSPGTIIKIDDKAYQVESSVKVTVPKGTPFIKTKLKEIETGKVVEKNFKPNQNLEEISPSEKRLEYLYMEGKDYLFLDVDSFEQVLISDKVIKSNSSYLKEGVEVRAEFFGDIAHSVELPQFLELQVVEVILSESPSSENHLALLETGAKVSVPSFIDVGDKIKVDTRTDEYIQRV